MAKEAAERRKKARKEDQSVQHLFYYHCWGDCECVRVSDSKSAFVFRVFGCCCCCSLSSIASVISVLSVHYYRHNGLLLLLFSRSFVRSQNVFQYGGLLCLCQLNRIGEMIVSEKKKTTNAKRKRERASNGGGGPTIQWRKKQQRRRAWEHIQL